MINSNNNSMIYPIMEITTPDNLRFLAAEALNWYNKADELDAYCCEHSKELDKQILSLILNSRTIYRDLASHLKFISNSNDPYWRVYCSWDKQFEAIQGIVVQTFDKYTPHTTTIQFAATNPANIAVPNKQEKKITGAVAVLMKHIFANSYADEQIKTIQAAVPSCLLSLVRKAGFKVKEKEWPSESEIEITKEEMVLLMEKVEFQFKKEKELNLKFSLSSKKEEVKSTKASMVWLEKPVVLDAMLPLSSHIEELHFSEEEIEFLSSTCFGLRHVTGTTLAEAEKKDGSGGCSLALSPQFAKFRDLKHTWKNILPEEKAGFIQSVEQGIDDFISKSFLYDYVNNRPPLYQNQFFLVEDILKVMEMGCYAIIDYRFNDKSNFQTDFVPSDLELWGKGLGRHPKMSIDPQQISSIPFFKASDLKLSKTEMTGCVEVNGKAYDQLLNQITILIRSAVIRTIRECSSKK